MDSEHWSMPAGCEHLSGSQDRVTSSSPALEIPAMRSLLFRLLRRLLIAVAARFTGDLPQDLVPLVRLDRLVAVLVDRFFQQLAEVFEFLGLDLAVTIGIEHAEQGVHVRPHRPRVGANSPLRLASASARSALNTGLGLDRLLRGPGFGLGPFRSATSQPSTETHAWSKTHALTASSGAAARSETHTTPKAHAATETLSAPESCAGTSPLARLHRAISILFVTDGRPLLVSRSTGLRPTLGTLGRPVQLIDASVSHDAFAEPLTQHAGAGLTTESQSSPGAELTPEPEATPRAILAHRAHHRTRPPIGESLAQPLVEPFTHAHRPIRPRELAPHGRSTEGPPATLAPKPTTPGHRPLPPAFAKPRWAKPSPIATRPIYATVKPTAHRATAGEALAVSLPALFLDHPRQHLITEILDAPLHLRAEPLDKLANSLVDPLIDDPLDSLLQGRPVPARRPIPFLGSADWRRPCRRNRHTHKSQDHPSNAICREHDEHLTIYDSRLSRPPIIRTPCPRPSSPGGARSANNPVATTARSDRHPGTVTESQTHQLGAYFRDEIRLMTWRR